jgi:indolepyruvate ferredoxin oxidoreductase beta subunit
MNKQLIDTSAKSKVRPVTIAVLAMGGEGGGVLADWIIDLAEHGGYLAQTTSVPGVAQRTGATIYYVELFPKAAARDQAPVLALMPVPGDVDIVLASELMEAARAVGRGLVTPDRTTLIASTHRVYSMNERIALTDGRVDSDALLQSCTDAARKLHAFDMAALAEATGSLVSAVLFGALAGAGALPFPRPAFEATIRRGGVGVEGSLKAFAAGFEYAAHGGATMPVLQKPDGAIESSVARSLLASFDGKVTATSQPIMVAGVSRVLDYQGPDYARLYLERLAPVAKIDAARSAAADDLLSETARQLALGMAYEDTIRVAELKIRASRFEKVREEVGVKSGQLLEIAEFMHPRTQEIAETVPASLGRLILNVRWIRALTDRMTRSGRVIKTTSLGGFLLLYIVASLKPFRARSLRYIDEQKRLSDWLATVIAIAPKNYDLAVAVARVRELVKGYGDTHERGRAKFDAIMALVQKLAADPNGARTLDALRKAAGQDERGEALTRAIAQHNLG